MTHLFAGLVNLPFYWSKNLPKYGGPSIWMFPKIMGFPPKSSILIGFSMIFTIHFGGFPPILGNTHVVMFRHLRHWSTFPLAKAPAPGTEATRITTRSPMPTTSSLCSETDANAPLSLYMFFNIYLEPGDVLYLGGFTLQNMAKFQSKQGSLGFQVYIYIS